MKIEFGEIAPFYMDIHYSEDEGDNIEMFDQHVHPQCEICINLSGDVSFMVEDSVYPIVPGSVIFARPFEAHHCIYHTKASHKHFWILFSANGNEQYFDLFFNRNKGQGNHIVLSTENTEKISEICRRLMDSTLDDFTKYSLFFDLIGMIKSSRHSPNQGSQIHKEIADAVIEINRRIGEKISIPVLAEKANMSLRTFERNFRREIGTTPMRYIKTHRLAISKSHLASGRSVAEVSEMCGYPDTSYFVSEFKHFYGITPLKYKQKVGEGRILRGND